MTQGILSRYLSGIGTDPLTQQGGMEGYLSQYNVNPYWQQFLQNGNEGLLAGNEQQYTQGNQNPYYQGDNVYGAGQEQQQQTSGFSNEGLTVLSGGLDQRNANGGLNPGTSRWSDLVLSDGRTIPSVVLEAKMSELQKNPAKNNNAGYAELFGDAFTRDPSQISFVKGQSLPLGLIPDAWKQGV